MKPTTQKLSNPKEMTDSPPEDETNYNRAMRHAKTLRIPKDEREPYHKLKGDPKRKRGFWQTYADNLELLVSSSLKKAEVKTLALRAKRKAKKLELIKVKPKAPPKPKTKPKPKAPPKPKTKPKTKPKPKAPPKPKTKPKPKAPPKPVLPYKTIAKPIIEVESRKKTVGKDKGKMVSIGSATSIFIEPRDDTMVIDFENIEARKSRIAELLNAILSNITTNADGGISIANDGPIITIPPIPEGYERRFRLIPFITDPKEELQGYREKMNIFEDVPGEGPEDGVFKVSTRMGKTIEEVVKELNTRLDTYIENYEGAVSDTINAALVRIELIITDRKYRGLTGGGAGGKSMSLLTKLYIIISPKSKSNCLEHCVALARADNKTRMDYIIGNTKEIGSASKSLRKQSARHPGSYAKEEDIESLAKYVKTNIELFDNQHKPYKTFEGGSTDKQGRTPKRDPIKIILSEQHYTLMLRRNNDTKELGTFIDERSDIKSEIVGNFQPLRRSQHPTYNPAVKSIPIDVKYKGGGMSYKNLCADIETVRLKDNSLQAIKVGLAWREKQGNPNSWINHVKQFAIDNKDNKFGKRFMSEASAAYNPPEEEAPDPNDDTGKCYIEFSRVPGKTGKEADPAWMLMEYISDNIEQFKGSKLWFHNGGKFDSRIIWKYCLGEEDAPFTPEKCSTIHQGPRLTKQVLLDSRTNDKITLRDSYALIPSSLEKLCRDLKVKHQKLTETIDVCSLTEDNYYEPEINEKLSLYLKHDCLGLLEVLETFGKAVFDALGVDALSCITAASLSKRVVGNKLPKNLIYHPTEHEDYFVRKGYFGGRVEAFKLGKVEAKGLFYYDACSMYPAMMNKKYLPVGEGIRELFPEGTTLLPEGYFGMVNVLARHKPSWLKMSSTFKQQLLVAHSLKKDGRLVFPILENYTNLYGVFTETLDFEQYDYIFLEGYKYKRSRFMSNTVKTLFNMKSKSGKDGNEALKEALKIILNSSYGFFGIRCDDVEQVDYSVGYEMEEEAYTEGTLIDSMTTPGGVTVTRYKTDIEIGFKQVAIASAISSYARQYLTIFCNDIIKVGGEIYYMDTDSIQTNINISKYFNLSRKYQWDGTGDELGSWKNELHAALYKKSMNEDTMLDLLEQYKNGDATGINDDKIIELNTLADKVKTYGRLKDKIDIRIKDEGNIGFSRLVILGCKQYSIEFDDPKGELPFISLDKCKGWSQKGKENKLNFDRLVSILPKSYKNFSTESKNYPRLSQAVDGLSCAKDRLTSEKDFSTIYAVKQKKTMRLGYTKGKVHRNGKITPFKV